MSKLWIIGCSIAHGVGVDTGQRWGDIVAKQLGTDAVFLTAEGSSIEWAADQILRADINRNDHVCWGLTTPNRHLWYDDLGNTHHLLNVYYQNRPGFRDIVDPRHLVDLNLAYKAVNYVQQVQNYLGKIQCQFAINYTLPGLDEHRQILIDHLTDSPGFFIGYDETRVKYVDATTFLKRSTPANDLFVDVGSDGFHPGPKQHELYAEQFLKQLNK